MFDYVLEYADSSHPQRAEFSVEEMTFVVRTCFPDARLQYWDWKGSVDQLLRSYDIDDRFLIGQWVIGHGDIVAELIAYRSK